MLETLVKSDIYADSIIILSLYTFNSRVIITSELFEYVLWKLTLF